MKAITSRRSGAAAGWYRSAATRTTGGSDHSRIAGAAALSFTVGPNTSDLQVLADTDDVAAAIRHVERMR